MNIQDTIEEEITYHLNGEINNIYRYMKWGCKIKLGTWLEQFIDWVTFGNGKYYAYIVAVKWLGYKSCGCDERKEFLDNLTCKK